MIAINMYSGYSFFAVPYSTFVNAVIILALTRNQCICLTSATVMFMTLPRSSKDGDLQFVLLVYDGSMLFFSMTVHIHSPPLERHEYIVRPYNNKYAIDQLLLVEVHLLFKKRQLIIVKTRICT